METKPDEPEKYINKESVVATLIRISRMYNSWESYDAINDVLIAIQDMPTVQIDTGEE